MINFVRSGAVSGAASALAFTALHQWLISDIWSSLPIMMGAGAICGLSIGWVYGLVFARPSHASWLGFNSAFVAMFVAQAALSIAVFEPITTFAEVIATNESPTELIVKAMPMTLIFTGVYAAIMAALWGRSWRAFGALLAAALVLNLTLGINVTPLGLVDIPASGVYVVAKLFGLMVALAAIYAVMFAALERKKLA